jgi:aspartyl-tRNA(Asn)/glutamyl-tRNA(Gln) amidotransferase subunit A
VNVMDGCALTIPCHDDGALPVGLSIVGSAFADASVLAIGRSVEAVLRAGQPATHAMPWPQRWTDSASALA